MVAREGPLAVARTGVRRSELLASLSLAIDVGLGQPMEHMLRSCLIALRLADAIGLDQARRPVVYYADLVAWIGCHADSHAMATMFGDDIGFRADMFPRDRTETGWRPAMLSHVALGQPLLQRGLQMGTFLFTGPSQLAELVQSHCVSAGLFAERLGLGASVRNTLEHTFERWDGKGLPAGLKGEQLSLEMRIVHIAEGLEIHHRLGGIQRATEVARARSGAKYDPALVDVFCRKASNLLASLEVQDVWQAVVEAAPLGERELGEHDLDLALEVMADFADVKSPFTSGHSRGVAALTAEAAARLGMAAAEVVEVRGAALIHDLGRMGVSNLIWDKAGPLGASEWERVRLHPYLTERMLSRPVALRRLGQLASRHHERVDGGGYPHGLPGAALTPAARILAAADTYHAMLEPRPHRRALSAADAAGELRSAVRAGAVDAEAADAVLRAAGHRVGRHGAGPAGLTTREVEILALVARGSSNRDIGRALCITEKTVRNHLDHVYSKAGVSNRTGATLFAIQNGLTGHFPHQSQ
jgi:HD-GYP domain-containing protein (c-di-GMP phosphodiesterase class II)